MIVVPIAGLVGAIYSMVVYPEGSANPGDWRVGAATGILIALFSIPLEIFSREFPLMVEIRELPRGLRWLTRSSVHTSIILTVLLGTQYVFDTVYYGRPAFSTIDVWETAQDAVFCAFVLVATVFVLEMRALLGGRVLATAMLGGYAAPAEEQRLFMIVDMVGSSEAAEQLGGRRYHGFLSEVFRLVEGEIEDEGGEIYTYVGDALFATWPLESRRRNARALNAAVRAFASLDRASASFKKTYGRQPRVRAALHGGTVVIGQYGDVRRQVTYLGEALNVASRMERFAKNCCVEILISAPLLAQTALPAALVATPLADAELAGWKGPVDILALRRKGAASDSPSLTATSPADEPKRKAVS
jgi:class 3 adenylate cyclase